MLILLTFQKKKQSNELQVLHRIILQKKLQLLKFMATAVDLLVEIRKGQFKKLCSNNGIARCI